MLWRYANRIIREEDLSPDQMAGVSRKEDAHICRQTLRDHIHTEAERNPVLHLPHPSKTATKKGKMTKNFLYLARKSKTRKALPWNTGSD